MLGRLFSKAAARPIDPDAAPPPSASPPGSRSYEVGWLFNTDKSSVIWDAPKPVRQEAHTTAAKSVAFCPSVIDFDRRHFVINSPIDVHMRLAASPDGKLNVTNILGEKSPVRSGTLNQMLVFAPQNEWRHPQRPVIQVATPYLFIADDPVHINQFPPFLHHDGAARPGVQLCGRFPIDVWPRILMWAFEWHDLSKDLILKRGQPWFYVRFETPDPSASVRLVEAQRTPELESYVASLTDVTNYVSQTYSLMKTARERRPEKLLVPKTKS
jgi:hypothetical protein